MQSTCAATEFALRSLYFALQVRNIDNKPEIPLKNTRRAKVYVF
jgi:hypothetical protein